MKVRILEGETRLINLRTRMPFKYGIATMTDVPYAFLHLRVEVDGKQRFHPAVVLELDHWVLMPRRPA